MPTSRYGPADQTRTKCLLKALLAFADGDLENCDHLKSRCSWKNENTARPELVVRTKRIELEELTAKCGNKLKADQIRASLKHLEKFLGISEDHRPGNKGLHDWYFTLKLWSRNKEENLTRFDEEWKNCKDKKSSRDKKSPTQKTAVQDTSPSSPLSLSKIDHVPDLLTDWQQICRGMLPIQLDNPLISGDGVTLGIEDIVPLDLVERKERPKPTCDPLPENSQQALEDQEIPLPYSQFFDCVLKGCRSLNQQGKGVAIIGEPGAGKTTLLCAIADWIIKQRDLPIFVSLQDLETVPLESFLLKNWLKNALRKREALDQFQDNLVEQCNAGRVWLLLDGVDEMAHSDRFFSVFAKEFKGWLADACVVLTCRVNVWEANRNDLCSRFEVYRSRGFNNDDQSIFIQNFFAKANELETGSKLITELESAPLRLKDLVKTPLWLTLLCRIWKRRKGSLPETKAELYRQFTETFYDWKDKPHVSKEKRPLLEKALGKLAKKSIDQEQFRFRLRETSIREELDKFDSSLFDIACELGWINKLGSVEDPYESVYTFLHPTFQEYFAALAIDDWDFFLPREHKNKPVEGKRYRIFEPQWKEIACFWVEKNSKKSNDLINSLYIFDNSNNGKFVGYYHYTAKALASILTIRLPFQTPEHMAVFYDVIVLALKNYSYISSHIKTYITKEDSQYFCTVFRSEIFESTKNYKEPEDLLDPAISLISLQPYEELNFNLLEEIEAVILNDFPQHKNWVRDRVDAVYSEYKPEHYKAISFNVRLQKALKKNKELQKIDFGNSLLFITQAIVERLEEANKNIEDFNKDELIQMVTHLSMKKDYSFYYINALERLTQIMLIREDKTAINFLLDLILNKEPKEWIHNTFMLSRTVFKVIKQYPSTVSLLLRNYLYKKRGFEEEISSQTCYRELLFLCAKNMSYSDFYEVWNNSLSTNVELPIYD